MAWHGVRSTHSPHRTRHDDPTNPKPLINNKPTGGDVRHGLLLPGLPHPPLLRPRRALPVCVACEWSLAPVRGHENAASSLADSYHTRRRPNQTHRTQAAGLQRLSQKTRRRSVALLSFPVQPCLSPLTHTRLCTLPARVMHSFLHTHTHTRTHPIHPAAAANKHAPPFQNSNSPISLPHLKHHPRPPTQQGTTASPRAGTRPSTTFATP